MSPSGRLTLPPPRTRSPQLRAAARLCRIAMPAERPARLATLGAIHATFTEERSSPDLLEAAELLG